ncbi:hypothetical protein [Thalassococcus profundi]|uniref:hypothetical protein n=1 Tax=Thalassococcus profundi TaxID=2282382 RepID=UPI001F174973|nr:hypothetical protein [Thalassococcus profundi]
MVKLVLLHKADSIYEDEPDVVYDFPRSYLKAIEEAVGDWIVYYEPVKAGLRGYFAVAKIERVIPKPGAEGRFLAMIEPGTFLPFDREVPRLVEGRPMEAALTEPDGTPKKGGAACRAAAARGGLRPHRRFRAAAGAGADRGYALRSAAGRIRRGCRAIRAPGARAPHP